MAQILFAIPNFSSTANLILCSTADQFLTVISITPARINLPQSSFFALMNFIEFNFIDIRFNDPND